MKALLIRDQKRDPTYGERFVSGSLAGAFAQSIIYPLEVSTSLLYFCLIHLFKGVKNCALRCSRLV